MQRHVGINGILVETLADDQDRLFVFIVSRATAGQSPDNNWSSRLAVAQDPYQEGIDGVQQALNAANGKTVTANIGTPLTAITPANVNSASVQPYIYKTSC